jgi:hypothetical protein
MLDSDSFLVPDFISAKIKALNPSKSLLQIADEAGFRRLETLSNVITGHIALPMDRVGQLAAAIDCSVGELTRLALKDWRLERLLGPLLNAAAQDNTTTEEHEIIALLRAHRGSREFVIDDKVRAWVAAFPEAA